MIPTTLAPVVWTPLRDYHGANHVLAAGCCFVHPGNGNQYFWANEQIAGAQQNLAIYRWVAKTDAWEHVVTFEGGGKDAESHITAGSVQIGTGGGLIVATSLVPKGVPHVTNTGFQGVRCRIDNIDAPWSLGTATDPALVARIAALEHAVAQQQQQLVEIQTALGNVASGGLSAADRSNLDWIGVLRAAITMA